MIFKSITLGIRLNVWVIEGHRHSVQSRSLYFWKMKMYQWQSLWVLGTCLISPINPLGFLVFIVVCLHFKRDLFKFFFQLCWGIVEKWNCNIFKAYNMMICYMYMLWKDSHHQELTYPSHLIYLFFFKRLLKFCSLS